MGEKIKLPIQRYLVSEGCLQVRGHPLKADSLSVNVTFTTLVAARHRGHRKRMDTLDHFYFRRF